MPHIVYWMHLPSIWITRQQSSRICTSNSLCLHTDGWFFSLCSPLLVLLLLNLSRCVYRRWITLHFHSEMHWIKKKQKKTPPVCGEVLWPTLPFPWTSLSGSHVQISVRFTHCLRLSSGPWGICSAGWPAVGVRASGCVFFFFFFFPMLNWPLRAQGGSR